MANNYSIIWKHFDKDSDTGKHLKAEGTFSLPYFLDGLDKENFEKRLATDLNAVHLIKGLLVGYFDKPPGTDPVFAKSKTKEILTEHLEAFQSPSLEDFVLDFASFLREHNGMEASLQALMTGVEIIPESNNIKYDCALDLYNCIEEKVLKDEQDALHKLNELIHQIDSEKLNPELLDDYSMLKNEVKKKLG